MSHSASNVTVQLRARLLVYVALLLVGGNSCTVGPEHVPPEPHPPSDWNTELPPGLRRDKAALSEWWTTLNDSQLNGFIEQAVRGNLSLRQAVLRIHEARAQRAIASGGRFPTLDATGSARRVRLSESVPLFGGQTESLYAIGFDAGWELDLFGRIRRQVETAEAQVAASEEGYRDVLVTLIAEVALGYTEVRSLQERLGVLEENRMAQEKTLELVQANVEAGEVSRLDLEQARTHLELTRSLIPPVRNELEHAKSRLALLLGRQPGALDEQLAERRGIPVPPASIAIGVPAEALRRRPDVRRAERELAAQTAQIGVATADLYPRFQLLGTIGLASIGSADLLSAANRTFGIGPSMRWNLFDAGRIRRNIEVQEIRQEQALVAYEQAVLGALRDVEDAILAFGAEELRRQSLLGAEESAKRTVAIAHDRYAVGEVSFLTVLDAERSLLAVQDQLATSNARVTSFAISLFKALGGGWTSLAPERSAGAHETTKAGEPHRK